MIGLLLIAIVLAVMVVARRIRIVDRREDPPYGDDFPDEV